MHKRNLENEKNPEMNSEENSPLSEKDLKKISERKKLQNKVFEKMINELKKK